MAHLINPENFLAIFTLCFQRPQDSLRSVQASWRWEEYPQGHGVMELSEDQHGGLSERGEHLEVHQK